MAKRVLLSVILILVVVIGIAFGAMRLFSQRYATLISMEQSASQNGTTLSNIADGTDAEPELNLQGATAEEKASFRETTTNEASVQQIQEATATSKTIETADDASIRAAEIVDRMTLTEKICQMMIVSPEALTGYSRVQQTGTVSKNAYTKFPVGGLIYYPQNLVSQDQTREMITQLQDYVRESTGLGMFYCVNDEGGSNSICSVNLGTTVVDTMAEIGATGDTARAKNAAATQATEFKSIGINVNFAPCGDVLTNEQNTMDTNISYGSDPQLVADMVTAAVSGYRDNDVLCAVKYFPGYGSTGNTRVNGFLSSDISLEELEANDFAPFRAAVDSDAPMIMVGHITFTQLDNEYPASLSRAIVTGLLREELGYDGIIITEALNANNMSTCYTNANAAVQAISAGCDMLLCVSNISSVVNAVTKAVNNGTLSETTLDESCIRIISAKIRYGIITS